jgi:poly-gamma-glutamate capsule biosynthesis protein CapA/YwtB (metallophosphatase superfamily)
VLPHWGTEHDPAPDDEQHALAARLIAAGADIIAGSGPHTRQPLVFENGALVSYSLGNLIFDGPGPDLGWSRGALLEVTVASDGRIIRARELPVAIAPDGTPRLPGDNATSPR